MESVGTDSLLEPLVGVRGTAGFGFVFHPQTMRLIKLWDHGCYMMFHFPELGVCKVTCCFPACRAMQHVTSACQQSALWDVCAACCCIRPVSASTPETSARCTVTASLRAAATSWVCTQWTPPYRKCSHFKKNKDLHHRELMGGRSAQQEWNKHTYAPPDHILWRYWHKLCEPQTLGSFPDSFTADLSCETEKRCF